MTKVKRTCQKYNIHHSISYICTNIHYSTTMNFTLRPWNNGDIGSLVKYANNKNIARYLTNAFPHPYTHADGEKFIKLFSQDNPTRVFAIDVENEAVGSIGIFPQTDVHCKNAETGYWLAEPFWGKGIVTAAIKQMVEYGFNTFDIDRIFARPFGSNLASQRVLVKAGFKPEARFEKAIFKNGIYEDECYYAIRKNEMIKP
ncbi:MAG TPA: GNAT family protein [Bacteroidales bacterium]|nr:GNAT family protein [Bacteroidales bacterium]